MSFWSWGSSYAKSTECERFNIPETDCAIHLMMGDITKVPVDCIVNAATNSLMGGGGVDGAIHRAAGAGLLRKCMAIPPSKGYGYEKCPTGSAMLTKGPFGRHLLATHVIHTVGPVVSRRSDIEEESEALQSCIVSSLQLAILHDFASIAFPAVSCGIYNGMGDKWTAAAAKINIECCKNLIGYAGSKLKHVSFVFTEESIYAAWRSAILEVIYGIKPPEPAKNPEPAPSKTKSKNSSISPVKQAEEKQTKGKGKGNGKRKNESPASRKDSTSSSSSTETTNLFPPQASPPLLLKCEAEPKITYAKVVKEGKPQQKTSQSQEVQSKPMDVPDTAGDKNVKEMNEEKKSPETNEAIESMYG